MFSSLSLWIILVVFAISASAIWWAGTRLEFHADRIAKRTGLGQSFTGLVLLASATSLPEVATTVTAIVVLDNPALAVNNLLGGVAMQTAIIVIADAAKRRRGALTFFAPSFVLLLQGVGLLMLLQVTIGGVVTQGMPSVLGVSAWAVAIAAVYLAILYLTYRSQGQPRWTPSRRDDIPEELRPAHEGEIESAGGGPEGDRKRLGPMLLAFAGFSVIVLIGGFVATQAAETFAKQTGMADAFVGATLLATATSLPEVSTTLSAARGDRYTVVISNIFGSNAFDVALLFVAELLYTQGTIFEGLDMAVVFVPVIGAVMTCLYLWGLMERGNRTVLRVGWDSAAALVVYAGGVIVLYLIT